MRFLFLILFLPVMVMVMGLHASAQTGGFGDPIYTFDFGSGPNPGPPLGLNPAGTNYTNMMYTTGCPNDGYYTIINSLNNTNNCHESTWINIPADHTGNPNGYFMLINASYTPSIFFTAPLPTNISLCQNTEYEFSAYIANLISQNAGAGTIDPDITFTVTAPDGKILATQNTGDIPPSLDDGSSPWKQFLVQFNTLGYSTVTVTMTNNADGGNGNDLALDDISFAAYGPAVQTPQPVGFSNPPANICEGDNAQYYYSIFPPVGYTSSQWQENINGTGWFDIKNQTEPTDFQITFQNAKTGTYQYRLGVAIGDNINNPDCRVYSPGITITVNPLPVIGGLEASESACAGSTLALMAAGDATSYKWTGPNLPPTNANPLILTNLSAANAGTYTVTAFSQYNCQSTATTRLSILPQAAARVSPNTRICQGDSTQLRASGGVSYLWSPGSTLSDSTSATPFASPTDTTTYKVIVTNANGCQDSAKTTVSVLKAPIANAGAGHVIFAGQSVQLNGTVKYSSSAYWTPATGLSDPNTLNPFASPTQDTKYTLHALSANNCGMDTSSIFIRVYQKITIPNTFTPNNDNNNDTWEINALITYPNCSMLVFNRYGQAVFKSTGYAKPWDGTYEGKPVPAGAYYYVLDLKDNKPPLSGFVMVVR
jgi:gliding motility-associated-like protein